MSIEDQTASQLTFFHILVFAGNQSLPIKRRRLIVKSSTEVCFQVI